MRNPNPREKETTATPFLIIQRRDTAQHSPPAALKFDSSHLSYCTNIHPAETWAETEIVLKSHVLEVRDRLRAVGALAHDAPFAIGLRLSAIAAKELLENDHLSQFRDWLTETNTYVFTINGFPYGSFHGTRVKEQVFMPDWTSAARLSYTMDLFQILAAIARPGTGASVSTLPASHKSFAADETPIFENLIRLASWLDQLAAETGHDFHLGLEPEPLGHFENTAETLAFFSRLQAAAPDPAIIRRRIGVNYDACHFALEYDSARASLDALTSAGIRLSKIHLSSALALDPRNPAALDAIRPFNEPVYFHQTLLRASDGAITRIIDLPEFFASAASGAIDPNGFEEMRVHFHIPLDAEPDAPLKSTRGETIEVLAWHRDHPDACPHFEIETYTWGVLPGRLQRPVEEQIACEYQWVIAANNAP
ncbi:MAG: metabolite traffic protein EboE [Verrucomicrobiota bacterium]